MKKKILVLSIFFFILFSTNALAGNTTIFEDGFEIDISTNWTTTGTEPWIREGTGGVGGVYEGSWDAEKVAKDDAGDLISKAVDTSGAGAIYVDFYYQDDDCDVGDMYLDYNDSSGTWDEIFDLTSTADDIWQHYTQKITDPQYLHSGFAIRFRNPVALAATENFWVDIVKIIKEIIDSDPPTFEYNNSNDTDIYEGDPVLIYANWSDATGLGYAWLWTNETGGIGQNYTGGTYGSPIDINLISGETWSNFTWDNDTFTSGVVAWKIYANDTVGAGNENVTGEGYITVTQVTRWLEVNWTSGSEINSAACQLGSPCNWMVNTTKNANATVTCKTNPSGYSCGTVSGSVRYNSSGGVKIYNFSGITSPSSTHRADYGNNFPFEPDQAGTEASDSEYNFLSADDTNRWTTSSDSQKNYQKYRFKIDESADDITNLTVLWRGIIISQTEAGCGEPYNNIGNLYFWNFSSESWEAVETSFSAPTDTSVTKSYTSNINHLVNSYGWMFLYVQTAVEPYFSCLARVRSDFVKVEVNSTGYTYNLISTTEGATPFYIKNIGDVHPESWYWEEGEPNNPDRAADNEFNDTSTYTYFYVIKESSSTAWKREIYVFNLVDGTTDATLFYTWSVYGGIGDLYEAYVDIWNWTTSSWVEVESKQSESLTSKNITLNSSYIHSNGTVKVRFSAFAKYITTTSAIKINLYDTYIPEVGDKTKNTISCGSMSTNDQCQLNWTINATGDTLPLLHVLDANFSSSLGESAVPTNNTSDAYVRIGGVDLKDQIISPCLNSSTTNDYCNPTTNPTAGTGVTPGSVFNITFRFVNSTSISGTVNQTIHLKWDYSTDPKTNQITADSSYIDKTTDCSGRKVVLKNVYTENCGDTFDCTFITTGGSAGDVIINQSTLRSDYDGNITFEIQFCDGTAGQTFDISPYKGIETSTEGMSTLDSFIQITPAVIEVWSSQFATGNEIQSSPALGNISVDDGLETIIGSNDYKLYAINSTGNELWNYQTSGEIYGAPLLADVNSTYEGLEIIFGSCDNKTYALNGTGDLIWSYTTEGCIGSSPDVEEVNGDNITVISSFDDNKTWAFFANNGTEKWNFTANGNLWASPVIANLSSTDYRVYIGSHDGNMYCINATNGSEIWNYPATVAGKNNWIESSAAVGNITGSDHLNVVFGSFNGRIYVLNASDGTYEWNFTVPGASPSIISSPVIVDVNNDNKMDVVIGSNTAYIFALNGTGQQIWNYTIPTGGRADSSPTVIDVNNDTYNDVVFGSSDNYIYALNGIDGSLIWRHNIGGSIWGSPAINNIDNQGGYEILVGSDSKNITAIDPPGSIIPSTLSMWGGDSARTRLHDNVPPENQIFYLSDTTVDPLQPITMNSLWRDSYSDIAYSTLDEDSSGSMISHSYELNNPDWVNYTFLGLRNGQTVNFIIRVYDSYGNVGTVSRSFTVGLTRQIVCGDGICDYGEAETCPQDCPLGKESEGRPTEEEKEKLPTLSSVIEEIMKRIGEKLPEAAKSLAPLIAAIVLIGIIIYVFVI